MSAEKDITEFADGTLWFSEEGGVITVGLTEKALDLVGAIQGIEFPEQRDEFLAEDWVGEIQGKDSTVPLLTPYAIRIEEINDEVMDEISRLEDDPTGDAWLFRAVVL